MTAPVPTSAAERLEELWKRIGAVLEGESPLPRASPKRRCSRPAPGTPRSTCASGTPGFARARSCAGGVEPGEIPEPLPAGVFTREGRPLAAALAAEGEVHGLLRLRGRARSDEAPEHAALLAFLLRLPRRRPPPRAPGPRRRVRAQGAPARARVALRPRPLARRAARSLGARRRGALPFDLADRRGQGRRSSSSTTPTTSSSSAASAARSSSAADASPGRCPRAA